VTATPVAARINVHATGLVVGGLGLLLRGPSGAGKSLLALELLQWQGSGGRAALLVGDDRIDLERAGPGVLMHTPRSIAGLIELRGLGIVRRPFVETAPVHLVVDLVDTLVRMVEESDLVTDLMGVTLPRCPVPRRGVVDSAHQLLLVGEALAALDAGQPRLREKFT
jgi:serine kinase of HPr protein (carbohydrate metabolism regulator)